MYSTCVHCNSGLGANEIIEAFPVGARLAVDPKKGRLWVICPVCKRWNLSPLEERWEAIEMAERLVEKLRPVAASDNIMLFSHPSGLKLVRLGGPTWRELTSWRYGARLQARRVVAEIKRVGAYVGTGALYVGALAVGASPLGVGGQIVAEYGGTFAILALMNRIQRRPVVRVGGEGGDATVIRRMHLASAKLESGDGARDWTVSIASDRGMLKLTDADAVRVASRALVRFNHRGAGREDLAWAMRLIEKAGSSESFLAAVKHRVADGRVPFHFWTHDTMIERSDFSGRLAHLPPMTRLALEIATSDQIEQRALEGELAVLERMWKEAEEIAAISDSLIVPQFVTEGLRRLRGV